jgi:hypothetical protein
VRHSQSTRQSWDAPDRDAALAEEQEVSTAATGVRGGAPRWVGWVLVAIAVALAVLNLFAFDLGWDDLVVLVVVLATVIGVIVALNPRRSSAVGGTSER